VFVANGKATNAVTLNVQGEASVEFKVGMQPGNNYRIAVTPFPANNLSSLQSSNAAAQYFVSAYTDAIRGGFNGELSPVLTVWRKLHFEIDSMETPPSTGPEANYVSRAVQYVSPNHPATGQSTIGLDLTPPLPMDPNQCERGTLQVISSGATFAVTGNHYQ
jgi:hypothetical protein